MDILKKVNAWFWKDDMWLPPNMTWDDLRDTRTVKYAKFSDLHNAFIVALILLVVRYALERFIFSPIGCRLGLEPKLARSAPSCARNANKLFEKALRENGIFDHQQIQGIAKQLDWSEEKVDRWIRRRLTRKKTLKKFTESAWRFTFYFCVVCYGVYTLWDKSWLYSINYCWYDFPHHNITNDIWRYYMLELGFYWSLTFSQFIDAKRKDFLQMFLHHTVTIALLTLSWATNFFRLGSLVLVIHDFADVPLEATKLARYVKNQRATDLCFAVFAVTWIMSRLVLFPGIIYNTLFKAHFVIPFFPAYYVFNSLLCTLQILHIVWTWFIIKIAIRAVSPSDPGVRDLRSDSEESGNSSSENGGGEEFSRQSGHTT